MLGWWVQSWIDWACVWDQCLPIVGVVVVVGFWVYITMQVGSKVSLARLNLNPPLSVVRDCPQSCVKVCIVTHMFIWRLFMPAAVDKVWSYGTLSPSDNWQLFLPELEPNLNHNHDLNPDPNDF